MRTKVKKQKMKTSLGDKIFVVINSAILICLCIITLYPIWYVFCASMTSNTYLVSHPGILLWPHEMTFGAYKLAFSHPLLLSGEPALSHLQADCKYTQKRFHYPGTFFRRILSHRIYENFRQIPVPAAVHGFPVPRETHVMPIPEAHHLPGYVPLMRYQTFPERILYS